MKRFSLTVTDRKVLNNFLKHERKVSGDDIVYVHVWFTKDKRVKLRKRGNRFFIEYYLQGNVDEDFFILDLSILLRMYDLFYKPIIEIKDDHLYFEEDRYSAEVFYIEQPDTIKNIPSGIQIGSDEHKDVYTKDKIILPAKSDFSFTLSSFRMREILTTIKKYKRLKHQSIMFLNADNEHYLLSCTVREIAKPGTWLCYIPTKIETNKEYMFYTNSLNVERLLISDYKVTSYEDILVFENLHIPLKYFIAVDQRISPDTKKEIRNA